MNSAAVRWVTGAMLVGAAPAFASGTWLDLNPPGAPAHPRVELDVSSIHQGLLGPEAVIRISRHGLQRHDLLAVLSPPVLRSLLRAACARSFVRRR